MLTMFDSVTVDAIPADAPAVAGYVGGAFHNYPVLVARWPHERCRRTQRRMSNRQARRCRAKPNGG